VLFMTLKKLQEGTLERIPQLQEEATYAPMIRKETGLINWSKSSKNIHNLVRGTNPWPCAYTFYKNERMRVWKTSRESISHASAPGTICSSGKEGLYVATGDGVLKILEIQFDSCRKMSVEEYIAGHKIVEGDKLG
jgi:methionyl-tRNA formyltransferase